MSLVSDTVRLRRWAISWTCSGSTITVRSTHPKERLLPQATVELVMDLREEAGGRWLRTPFAILCD